MTKINYIVLSSLPHMSFISEAKTEKQARKIMQNFMQMGYKNPIIFKRTNIGKSHVRK